MIVPLVTITPAACLPGCFISWSCLAVKLRQTMHAQLYTNVTKIVCLRDQAGAIYQSPQTAILSSQERQEEQR